MLVCEYTRQLPPVKGGLDSQASRKRSHSFSLSSMQVTDSKRSKTLLCSETTLNLPPSDERLTLETSALILSFTVPNFINSVDNPNFVLANLRV